MPLIVQVRRAGAKKVYLASASPPVRYPNVYGVDMPTRQEFVAFNLTEEEICRVLGADGLLYQSLEDLLGVGRELNPSIRQFEDSCFSGALQRVTPVLVTLWTSSCSIRPVEGSCLWGAHLRCNLVWLQCTLLSRSLLQAFLVHSSKVILITAIS